MPRKSKTQPVKTSADQAYGVAGEQKASMNVVPLPNTKVEPQATNGPPLQQSEVVPPPPSIFDIAANEMPPDQMAFSEPTGRPEEPLMTPPNLAPSAKAPNRVAMLLRSIAATSPNPDAYENLARIAERNKL